MQVVAFPNGYSGSFHAQQRLTGPHFNSRLLSHPDTSGREGVSAESVPLSEEGALLRLFSYGGTTAAVHSQPVLSFWPGDLRKPVQKTVKGFLPEYANSHTEISHTGRITTERLLDAERTILQSVNAPEHWVALGTENGETGARDKVISILAAQGWAKRPKAQPVHPVPAVRRIVVRPVIQRAVGYKSSEQVVVKRPVAALDPASYPVVLIAADERLSVALQWQRRGFAVQRVARDAAAIGTAIAKAFSVTRTGKVVVAVSLASETGGEVLDAAAVHRVVQSVKTRLKESQRLFWVAEAAAYGAYRPVSLEKIRPDAVILGPERLPGGSQASGVLLLDKRGYDTALPPSFPGGGTVDLVTGVRPEQTVYSTDVFERETAGTPGVGQFWRASLALQQHAQLTNETVLEARKEVADYLAGILRGKELKHRVQLNPGNGVLPVVSFRLKNAAERVLDSRWVSRVLFDHYGILAPVTEDSRGELSVSVEVRADHTLEDVNRLAAALKQVSDRALLLQGNYRWDGRRERYVNAFKPPVSLADALSRSMKEVTDKALGAPRQNGVLRFPVVPKQQSPVTDNVQRVNEVRRGVIGRNLVIDTPVRSKVLTLYADHTASGRPHRAVEKTVKKVLVNHHPEDVTAASEVSLLKRFNADATAKPYRAVPAGNGATGAVNRFLEYLQSENGWLRQIPESAEKPVVLVTPFEHHSNILPWQQAGFEVVEIKDADGYGTPDYRDLEKKLKTFRSRPLTLVSVSAASNVTSQATDLARVAKLVKKERDEAERRNVLFSIDVAAYASHNRLDLAALEADAVFVAPHKLLGGQQSSGVLITDPAALTVDGVLPEGFTAATADTGQFLRAALAFELQHVVGADVIHEKETAYTRALFERFREHPQIRIVGDPNPDHRYSIIPVNVYTQEGKRLHHHLVAQVLNDFFGIQVRSGCNCAGPYGGRLLGIDPEKGEVLHGLVRNGRGGFKPGWVRFDVNAFHTDADVEYLARALELVAVYANEWTRFYSFNEKNGRWDYKGPAFDVSEELSLENELKTYFHPSFRAYSEKDALVSEEERQQRLKRQLEEAEEIVNVLRESVASGKIWQPEKALKGLDDFVVSDIVS